MDITLSDRKIILSLARRDCPDFWGFEIFPNFLKTSQPCIYINWLCLYLAGALPLELPEVWVGLLLLLGEAPLLPLLVLLGWIELVGAGAELVGPDELSRADELDGTVELDGADEFAIAEAVGATAELAASLEPPALTVDETAEEGGPVVGATDEEFATSVEAGALVEDATSVVAVVPVKLSCEPFLLFMVVSRDPLRWAPLVLSLEPFLWAPLAALSWDPLR